MGFDDGTGACVVVHYYMWQKEQEEELPKNFF
jgi:hypothetical protein